MATPPLRRSFTHHQPNGEAVQVTKYGNGLYMVYLTQKGIPLLLNDEGALCYAIIQNGELRASKQTYSANAVKTPESAIFSANEFSAYIKEKEQENKSKTRALVATGEDGLGIYGQSAKGSVPSIGNITIPTIMVEFPDRTFQESSTIEKMSRRMNEKGYADENYCKGSVKDYFEAQSNAAFSPTFEIVCKIMAENEYAYYGKNNGSQIDIRATTLVKEVMDKAENSGVDFSQYTQNGSIPLINIIYAGPGEHSAFEEGCENYMWAHFREYRHTTPKGVQCKSYFVSNETFQNYQEAEDGTLEIIETTTDGIGVFCHEFSHALGLPDFYSSSHDSALMDFWSLMDYGQYAYDGYAPVPYLAYERAYMGWLNITELNATHRGKCTLYTFGQEAQGNTAYLLRNEDNNKEYFILENRQATTPWHPTFLGTGMLITHIDYNEKAWKNNGVNEYADHQRMQYVPADGFKQTNSTKNGWNDYKGDLYPGITHNTQFTPSSNPSSFVFTGEMNKPIYDIEENEEIITFNYLESDNVGSNISNIQSNANNKNEAIYDLFGRKVNQPNKGQLYLKNGQKVIMP
jgi:M6 family metalloprotease-like protein